MRPLFIEVYDHKHKWVEFMPSSFFLLWFLIGLILISGKHELVGHVQTNAAELQVGKEFPLIHPVAQKSKKHYTNSG